MHRIVPVWVCILLAVCVLCPAFCLAQTGGHACCHPEPAGTHAMPRGQCGMAQATQARSAAIPATLAPAVREPRGLPAVAVSLAIPPQAPPTRAARARRTVLRI